MFNLLKKMLQTGVVTTKEPFKSPPLLYRGTIDVDRELCTHCKTCVDVCPADAIRYQVSSDESFALLQFDYSKCMYCSLCVENCETGALTQTNIPKSPKRAKEGLIESFYLTSNDKQ